MSSYPKPNLSQYSFAVPDHLKNLRQWVSNEHVDHAGNAEARVHEDHLGGLLAHLTDDGRFFAAFNTL